MDKVCILGAGSWGTALAILLSNNGFHVYLWGRPEDDVQTMITDKENKRFLPGIVIPANINPTTDLNEALKGAKLVVMAVPSQAVREVTGQMKEYLPSYAYIVNVAKGLEISTTMRMSQVVQDILGEEIQNRYGVLSGPSHAEEVARKIPTAVTVAAFRESTAFYVQDMFMSPFFRVYTNPDVAGVELGGALKNIVALGTGMSYGLNYGDNTAAALITRGLAEIIRMGQALGGDPRTFSGLSGIGDLVVTCSSQHSRNYRAGRLLGEGKSLEYTLKKIGMVVEGVHTTRVVNKLAEEMNIEMPITRACYNIIYNKRSPREEVEVLMKRQKKYEIEEFVNDPSEW